MCTCAVANSSRMPSLCIPCSAQSCFQNSIPTWFPHCPTCNVIISRGIFYQCKSSSNWNLSELATTSKLLTMTSLYPLRSSLVSTSWLNSIKPQYTAQMYTKHEKDNLKLKIVASSDPKPKQNIVDTRFLPSAAVVLASLAFVDAG